MKKLVLLLCMLVSFATTNIIAQNSAKVKSMTLTTDHIPIAERQTDLNKEPCALVKIQVVEEIDRIEGCRIGDITSKGVEKRVFMCKGTKWMKIHFKKHLPIKVTFSDYGINSLESNRVYELIIEIPNANIIIDNPSEQEQERKQQQEAEKKRREEEQRVEQQKAEQERKEEQKRREEELKAEQQEAEQKRIEEQKRRKEERKAEQQKVEQKRKEEQKRREEEKKAKKQEAEQKRKEEQQIAKQQKEEKKRKEDLQKAEQQRAEQQRKAEQQKRVELRQKERKTKEKDAKNETANPVSFGFCAGLNLTQPNFEIRTGDHYAGTMSFHFGPTTNLLLNKSFALQGSVILSKKGFTNDNHLDDYDMYASAYWIDIPVKAAFIPVSTDFIQWYLFAGPYIAIGVAGNIKDQRYHAFDNSFFDTYKRFDYGVTAGTSILLGKHISIGASYQFGLDSNYKNNCIGISLGYQF